MKKIAVIGSGLLGCLTAFKIGRKFPKYQIYLIDSSNNILQSFKSIRMGNLRFNNGFHALDVDRCRDLYNFLKNALKVKFKVIATSRYLMIGDNIIKENQKIINYPLNLRNEFLKKSIVTSNINTLYKNISKKLQLLIQRVSKRYSNNLNDNLKYFIPWFLPSEYYLKSNDEGDIYRNNIRKINKETLLAVPKSGLFKSLIFYFKNEFKKIKNIKLMLGTKVFFENKNIILRKNDKILNLNFDNTFICTSSMIMIDREKKIFNEILSNQKYFITCVVSSKFLTNINFSEILCLNNDFIEFSRVSNIIKKNNRHLFLIELIFKSIEDLDKKLNKVKLQKILKPLFIDKAKSVKVIDYKVTRKMYFPKKIKIKQATKYVEKFINNISTKKNIVFNNINFGPINMAKAWIASENNLRLLK